MFGCEYFSPFARENAGDPCSKVSMKETHAGTDCCISQAKPAICMARQAWMLHFQRLFTE